MLRSLLLISLLLPLALWAQPQEPALDQLGWYALPDSLFLIWKLDDDQVRRLKVVEEDHEAERARLMADMDLSIPARDAQLRREAEERRSDVRSVIGPRLTDDWYVRMRPK